MRTASNNGSTSEPAATPAVGRETGPAPALAPDQAPAERSARDACVALAMGGDRGAIRRLWEENRRWVAAVLLAHKPALEELDDLLQEVAVTLVSKIHTLREETNFRAWLRTVAVNTARVAGRSGRLRPRAELPPEDALAAEPVGGGRSGSDEHRPLLDRIARLPESYREPLVLRAVSGMRSKQIARVLGVPSATVDTRIARARRMLREIEPAARVGPEAEPRPALTRVRSQP